MERRTTNTTNYNHSTTNRSRGSRGERFHRSRDEPERKRQRSPSPRPYESYEQGRHIRDQGRQPHEVRRNNNEGGGGRRRPRKRKRSTERRRTYRERPAHSSISSTSSTSTTGNTRTTRTSNQISPRRRRAVTSEDSVLPKQRKSSSNSQDDTHFRGGPGTLLDHRFRIVGDVGMGTFGRVVECIDQNTLRHGKHHHVAIKIVRNVKRYYDSALVEADILKHVNRRGGRGISHCVILFHSFTWKKSHFCMVFESLGLSLYDFMKHHDYQPFPPTCVRDFARQLMEALEFLHSFGLIHTDLKPENILLTNLREVPYHYKGRTYQIPESTKVKVIDFGGATYDHETKSTIVATRQYRAPEVLLATGWSMPSDMWSAGCILAELYLGELLFATHDTMEHLALIQNVLGPFPRKVLQHARNVELVKDAFDSNGRHRMDLPPNSLAYVKKVKPLECLIRPEDRSLLELLKRLLQIDPHHRATGHEGARFRW